MSQRPNPPDSLPKYLAEGLSKQSPETLRDLEHYAYQLAEYKEHQAQKQLEETTISRSEQKDKELLEDGSTPNGVPAKAGVTVKTINDNQYYYWQWRDGDKIKSEYIKPVSKD